MLAQLARELAIPDSRIGVIPTATMIGYALGILALAPLGDRLRVKRVLITKLTLLALAMAGAATAPDWTTLALWSFLIGMLCTAAQDALALAAQLTTQALRARAVATATSGILLGVLIGRLMGGMLADLWGWRAAFVAGGAVTALVVLPLAWRVPQRPPSTQLAYGALIGSLIRLWREYPALRAAVLSQCALFAGYGMFWAMVAPISCRLLPM